MDIPEEPVLFKSFHRKFGPFGDRNSKGSEKTDWEVELAVVIGKSASYISEADALNHVAGYVLHNDVSERVHSVGKNQVNG